MKRPVIWLSPAAARALARGKMPSPRDVAWIALRALALAVMIVLWFALVPLLFAAGAAAAQWAWPGLLWLRAMLGI
ncbi:MAG: hypothetical protein AB7E55_29390 [Pigmentiphaga sp.]